VDGAVIERSVMSGLKDFQRRTVDYVFKRMYLDDKPVSRFLVADEVGLGKTLVARGLVAKAINRLQQAGVKRIDVVYICSNADIAAQNVRRLNVTKREDFNLSSRITLLPVELRRLNENGLNFISITPSTSFDFGHRAGKSIERAVLLRLLEHAWGKQMMNRAGVYRLLQGGKQLQRFRDEVRSTAPKGVGEGEGQIDPTLAASFELELGKTDAQNGLKARFFDLVDAHTRASPGAYWNQRLEMISELRRLLARSCIAALEPDLIILDEFQRFRHLLEDPNPDDPDDIRSLAHALFDQPDAKVLMLSATPYKMYTLSDEIDDNHYQDFVKTSKFLLGNTEGAAFGLDLTAFRRAMFALGEGADLSELVRFKTRIERRLRKVMARTERLAVTEDRNGMLEQRASGAMRLESRDLHSFILTDRLSQKLGAGDSMEYWKSAPYLTNFMEGYKLKRGIREAIGDKPDQEIIELLRSATDGGLLSFKQVRAYEQVDPGNARLRGMFADTLDRGTWQLLWMPPSLPYYEPGPPYDHPQLGDLTKRLIFSSWTVAPQAIACLLSYEAERRMVRKGHSRRVNTAEARQRQRGLLRFARDSRNQERLVGMPVFGLLYPSPTLARLGDPLRFAAMLTPGRLPTRSELIDAVRAELATRLGPMLRRAPQGPVDENWYWAAALVLDAKTNPDVIDGWLGRSRAQSAWDEGEAETESDTAFAAHVEFARDSAHQPGRLGQPPDDLLEVLARAAVASPANAALRALARAVGDPRKVADVAVRDAAARIAWGFRALFNVPEVMALLRTAEGGDAAYWRAVLEYCFAGNLQAVLDEYLHVLPDWLGLLGREPEEMLRRVATEVHDVVALHTPSYGVEEVRETENGIELVSQKLRARYALRFGVRASDDAASSQRSGRVISAFNSPFWPFALVSTSLGQEGLDFHQYCHAVVHWNLPANPVDMEQREGRVHRYKGHAVRKNVARQQSGAGINSRGLDPWASMFEAARPPKSGHDRDLVPYWVYATEGGSRIERYVPALPMSRDSVKLGQMRRSLAAYRLVIGQPRQEDMLAYLGGRMSPEAIAGLAAKLRIDLTPR